MPHSKKRFWSATFLVYLCCNAPLATASNVPNPETKNFEFTEVPPTQILSRAKLSNPKSDYLYGESQVVQAGSYVWSRFDYETAATVDKWPYGSTFVLWNKANKLPVWSLDWRGDFPPHSISWIDFDGDGQLDLRFLSGEEDVYSTYIYLWRVKNNEFRKDNLRRAYQNKNDYSVLLDIDQDGRPEILDSGHQGDSKPELMCLENGDGPIVTDDLRAEIAGEYHRIVGAFNSSNFGLPATNQAWSLKLFDPFKILGFVDGQAKNLTFKFQKHIAWRLGVLRQIRTSNTGECARHLDKIIAHNQLQLTQSNKIPKANY